MPSFPYFIHVATTLLRSGWTHKRQEQNIIGAKDGLSGVGEVVALVATLILLPARKSKCSVHGKSV